jgi:hypothetical protein
MSDLKGPLRAFFYTLNQPLSFCLIPVAFLVFAPVNESYRDALRWDADAPHLYAWLTAHLTHWDMRHLITNAVGALGLYACISQLKKRISTWVWWVAFAINLIACDLYLALAYERSFYLGASSWLYGLWLLAALWLCQFEYRLGYLLLLLTLFTAAKPLMNLPEPLSIPTAYEVHFAALGASFAFWLVTWKRIKK